MVSIKSCKIIHKNNTHIHTHPHTHTYTYSYMHYSICMGLKKGGGLSRGQIFYFFTANALRLIAAAENLATFSVTSGFLSPSRIFSR